MDVDNTIILPKIFMAALGFAIFLHARHRRVAGALGITSRPGPWTWIPSQVCDFSLCPHWFLAGIFDQVCGACSDVSHRAGSREDPSYVTPELAKELFDLRNLVCLRRA